MPEVAHSFGSYAVETVGKQALPLPGSHPLTRDELRAAIEEGLASGLATPLDMDAVKRRARQAWEQSGRG